ncbi:MAG: methionyl-tRNA formyltransferase [Patescibacteria group bacterium]
MKIIFFGSSRFSLPVVEALLERHEIAAVVTTPPKPKGRKGALSPSPVAEFARARSIFILEPQKVGEAEEALQKLGADIGIVASFGKIIPENILRIPPLGVINVHPSLLPKWRGPSPIQSALLAGERETGITIHITTAKVDAGGILGQVKVPILPDETYLELEEKLSREGARLLLDILPRVAAGSVEPYPQDEDAATYSKRIATEDGKIDWHDSAEKIFNQIRALNPEPGTFTFVENANGATKRLIISQARREADGENSAPGTVSLHKDKCKIAARVGYIIPLEIQIEGKKKTDIASFLKGNPWLIGKRVR